MIQPFEQTSAWSVQHVALSLAGSGAALYFLLKSLPTLIMPWGFVTAALHVATGMLLALFAVAASAIGAWFMLSEAVPSGSVRDATIKIKPAGVDAEDTSGERAANGQACSTEGSTGATYAQLVAQMIPVAASAESPPPILSHNGEFSDWVYTIPTAKYDRAEALTDWPPETEGEKAVAAKWFAVVKGGVLFLAQKPPTSNNKFVPMVTVPLAGCQVEIPEEGLRSKSKWWKKCPLEVSHAQQILLSQQNSFFMFASNGFAKAQWYGALLWGATGGGIPRDIESMYYAFSAAVRGTSSVPHLLPQVAPSDKKGEGRTRQQGRWGMLKGAISFCNKTRTLQASKSFSNGPPSGDSAASVDPDDLDALWYAPKVTAAATAGTASQDALPRSGTTTSARDGCAVGLPTCNGGVNSLTAPIHAGTALPPRQEAVTSEGTATAAVPSLSTSITSPVTSDDETAASYAEAPACKSVNGTNQPSNAARLRRAMKPSRLRTPLPATGPKGAPHTTSASYKETDGGHKDSISAATPQRCVTFSDAQPEGKDAGAAAPPSDRNPSSEPSPKPPTSATYDNKFGPKAASSKEDWDAHTEPVEAAVNMLLTRVAFDLLRSISFRASAADYVQRKLDQIRYPPYIGPLKVVDISVGQSVPEVSNIRSLPSPDSAIWPQFLLDVCYHGEAWVMVETSVDLRSSAAWSQFDATIGQFGGETPVQQADPALVSKDNAADTGGESNIKFHTDIQKGRKLLDMGPLRKLAATRIRKMADSAAKSLSQIPLRLKVSISSVDGTMLAWLPPPPGDRMWSAFTDLRSLNLTAKPVVGSRMLKSTTQAMRASQWIESKLKRSITKNMMYPACSDMRLPLLIPWGHPQVSNPGPQASSGIGLGESIIEQPSSGGAAGAAASVAANMKARLKGTGNLQSNTHHTNLEALRATAEVLAAEDDSCGTPVSPPATPIPISSFGNLDPQGSLRFPDGVREANSATGDGAIIPPHHSDSTAEGSAPGHSLPQLQAPQQQQQQEEEALDAAHGSSGPGLIDAGQLLALAPAIGSLEQHLCSTANYDGSNSTPKTAQAPACDLQEEVSGAAQSPQDAQARYHSHSPRSIHHPTVTLKRAQLSEGSESGHLVAPASPGAATAARAPDRGALPGDRSSRIPPGPTRWLSSKGVTEARDKLGGFVSKNQSRFQELAGNASNQFRRDGRLKPESGNLAKV